MHRNASLAVTSMTKPEPASGALALHGNKKLKIWVPETVFEALTLAAIDRSVSRPELIRRLLFSHLFGRDALDKALDSLRKIEELNSIRFSRRISDDHPLFSSPDRADVGGEGETALPLGKSIADALVLVSDDIHKGLRHLAKRHGQPLGTYAAYVLCWAMFGRGVYSRLALKVSQGKWLGDEFDAPEERGSEL